MVLGNVGEQPVCYYCNKPGHVKRDCFKMRNDLAARGNARGNGRNGGRNVGGRQQRVNTLTNDVNVEDVIRLGMAAVVKRPVIKIRPSIRKSTCVFC